MTTDSMALVDILYCPLGVCSIRGFVNDLSNSDAIVIKTQVVCQ